MYVYIYTYIYIRIYIYIYICICIYTYICIYMSSFLLHFSCIGLYYVEGCIAIIQIMYSYIPVSLKKGLHRNAMKDLGMNINFSY